VTTLRRIWSGPFELADAKSLEMIEADAKSPELDTHLLPLEVGLEDVPCLPTTQEGAARMRNGNPGLVIASDAAFGDTAWAALDGVPVAIGVYKAGELHPTRVFQL
jgi:tRNA pseudouridine55 synthase